METTEYLYELLIRGKPGGISGAHQIRAYEVKDSNGVVVHAGAGTALPLVIGGTEWSAVIGQTLNDALAELDAVKAERDAALAHIAQLEAQLMSRAA